MGKVAREHFGFVDGKSVEKITLNNGEIRIEILSFGGIIKSIYVPSKNREEVDDIVLGFDNIDGYLGKCGGNPYFGCLVGRVANRIAGAKFTLEGKTYQLEKNNGENSLHGGLKGLDKIIWDVKIDPEQSNTVHLECVSPDGDNGFPGQLNVKVTYCLDDKNELDITYRATTDKATPVNLTNHSYFNLAGHGSGSDGLYNHSVKFNADKITPVDPKTLIPTGQLLDVLGTPFDLRGKKSGRLGQMISKLEPEYNGFDHNFCINQSEGKVIDGLRMACHIEHDGTGRALECYTNQPGVQFYTGNFLPDENDIKGKLGSSYRKHGGFCLETQAYPDSVNQPNFPNVILKPGEVYDHRTKFKFINLD